MTITRELVVEIRTKQQFSFFAEGDGAVANMDEDFSFNGQFDVHEIRAAFSGVCSADIYLRVYLSSVTDVVHNMLLFSYALSNSQYYRWEPSACPMAFLSGDTLAISCVTDNKFAVNVLGWSVVAIR